LAKRGEGFENCGDLGDAGAGEASGDGFGLRGGGRAKAVVAHGADTFGKRRGPGAAGDADRLKFLLFHFHVQTDLGGGDLLEFGTKPAGQSGALFGGAGGVQFDEAEEDVFISEVDWPTVGFRDGAVDVVVDVAEDGDPDRG